MTTRGETHDPQGDFRCCHRRRHRRRRAYPDRSFRRRRGKGWWWNGWRLSRPLGPWLRPRLWRNCGDRTQLLAVDSRFGQGVRLRLLMSIFSLGPGPDSQNRGPVHSMTGEWEMEKIILEH